MMSLLCNCNACIRLSGMLYHKILTRATSLSIRKWVCLLSKRATGYSVTQQRTAMDLKSVVRNIEEVAGTNLAEEWDNVGLLVEPSPPHEVTSILLTNDLTENVVDEVKQLAGQGQKVNMVISYHPPIFKPLKRLTQRTAKERMIVWALENKVAIYSPHTAHDSLWGGVNDWLLSGIGRGEMEPLQVKQLSASHPHTVLAQGSNMADEKTVKEIIGSCAAEAVKTTPTSGWGLEVTLNSKQLSKVTARLNETLPTVSLTVRPSPKVVIAGPGRLLTLSSPLEIQQVVEKIKLHLQLPHLRLALSPAHSMTSLVSSVAVCVGSGASLLRGVAADLYISGEMSHHELLEATSHQTSVILAEHSNSERGFLSVFKEKLEKKMKGVSILISSMDKDPVTIV